MIRRLEPGQAVAGALAVDRLGVRSITSSVLAAAAPLTIVAGLVTTAFAVTGNRGLPAGFVTVGLVLAVFAAGYVTMSRHVPHAGAFYAYAAHGLGRSTGAAVAWVSLVAYTALQVGLFGVIGAAANPLIDQATGVTPPWWVTALGAWGLVGVLGVLSVEVSKRVLAVLLVCEVIVIVVYDVAWLTSPAHGWAWWMLSPTRLGDPGVGSVLALAVLGFVGFETATVFAEEAKSPQRTVPAATYAGVVVIGVLYAVSSWAIACATGPDQVAAMAGKQGPDLVFTLAQARLGAGAATAGRVLFVTSIFAALQSFHLIMARFAFALGRERVLPRVFGATSRFGSPTAGSLVQSLVGLVVIVGWAVKGWDPVLTLFYVGGTTGALGVLILLTVVSVAVIGFFRTGRRGESVWATSAAPAIAVVALTVIVVLVVGNFATLLGVAPSSPLRWGIPAGYAVVAVAGWCYGRVLKTVRPQVWAAIGRGAHAAVPAPIPGSGFGRLQPAGWLTSDPGHSPIDPGQPSGRGPAW